MPAGESIAVQAWKNAKCGQVHYTDAAAGHQMTADGLTLQLSSFHIFKYLRCLYDWTVRCVIANVISVGVTGTLIMSNNVSSDEDY